MTPLDEIPRYFRALDFQNPADRQPVIELLALNADVKDPGRRSLIQAEALTRLGNADLSKNPQLRETVNQILKESQGTVQFVSLVGRFQLQDRYPELVTLVQSAPESQVAVDAVTMLFGKNQQKLLSDAIEKGDRERAEAIITALGNCGDKRGIAMLQPILTDEARPMWMRQAVVKALGASNTGGSELLKFAKGNVLQGPLGPALAASLLNSSNSSIREAGLKIFPSPPGKN